MFIQYVLFLRFAFCVVEGAILSCRRNTERYKRNRRRHPQLCRQSAHKTSRYILYFCYANGSTGFDDHTAHFRTDQATRKTEINHGGESLPQDTTGDPTTEAQALPRRGPCSQGPPDPLTQGTGAAPTEVLCDGEGNPLFLLLLLPSSLGCCEGGGSLEGGEQTGL